MATPWILAPYSSTDNWYYAMGGFSYAYSTQVHVIPPIVEGANLTIQIDYQMYVHDYYNWDQGKMVTAPRPTMPITGDPISIPIPQEYAGISRNWELAGLLKTPLSRASISPALQGNTPSRDTRRCQLSTSRSNQEQWTSPPSHHPRMTCLGDVRN